MNKIFNTIPVRKPKKNLFDLSHEVKMSMKMGYLVPFMCNEVVPGDKFRVSSEIMMRLAPLVSPVMHRVNVYTHFFFVPNRLIWDEWETFITGGPSGTSQPIFPTISPTASDARFAQGTLPDYFGYPQIPAGVVTGDIKVSALPLRAYAEIYNENLS